MTTGIMHLKDDITLIWKLEHKCFSYCKGHA